jgi:hypothetical protein
MSGRDLLRGLVLLLTAFALPAHAARIESVVSLSAQPVQFVKVEHQVVLAAEFKNPYRAAEITLDLEVTSPAGRRFTVPGFYERGPAGAASVWRLRWTPREAGAHALRVVLRTPTEAVARELAPVDAAASSRPGFLRVDAPWTLRFDDGRPFRGVGESLCWEARNNDDNRFFKALHEHERFNYDYLFGRLHALGGNFTRVWMCAWNLPLEWKQPLDTDRYRADPRHFNQSAAERLDAVVERAEATGVYLMLCLEHAGSLLNREWAANSYNAANGGPARTPEEFFTNPAARAQWRDRLRYLVARWSWSSSIAVWEFFNEVDNAMANQPVPIPDAVVTAWHAEMAAYLKAIDPVARPVTTSTSHRVVAGLEQVRDLDFIQRHVYRRTAEIPRLIRAGLADTGKPCVIGEFSYEWDWSKDFNTFAAAMDADLAHGLWSGVFSPTPILPLTWWWEFFDERGTIAVLRPVRAVVDAMQQAGQGTYAEVRAELAGAPGADVLAVRCGSQVFVLVRNGTAQSLNGRLQLAGNAKTASAWREFDATRLTWEPVNGPEFTVAAQGQRILVCELP